jgi:hypothetical protein
LVLDRASHLVVACEPANFGIADLLQQHGDGEVVTVMRDYETRTGAGRKSDVEEFEQAIIDLARVIGNTAIETEMRDEYVPVIRYLAHARRALREIYGKDV